MSAFSFISIGYLFIDFSVKLHYRKIRLTCCVLGRHEKGIKNKRICQHPFVPYLSENVLAKFYGKPSILHTLLIHLKRRDSLKKSSARFRLLNRLHANRLTVSLFPARRIIFRPRQELVAGYLKHVTPSQREMSIQKSRQPIKKRKPPAFTAC